ncbi:hypothetical protein Ahy_B08g091039 isoform A [Arachis hypogaea]|uniref:Uncharacterized protein n=1 Tax=Arachis hypogaea TaxID=3818 RepID=A0A444Y181_ARAHY|nr:hypothetical protein Ahy_B08g091039 isoform A [Arachis hypogaea]
MAIQSYTIYRVVDYVVYEYEPQKFYAKYKNYGQANMQRAGNIIVNRFDRRNKVFEVREMPSEKVLVVDLA